MLNMKSSQNKDEKWMDCRINSLYQFLLYYEIDIPRDYIFLLSEAYTYYYMYINFNDANISNVYFSAASESCLEINVLNALGFQFITGRLDDTNDSLKKMMEIVDKRKNPILMHSVEYMFIKDQMVLEKLKVNIRMQSIPILIGFDEKENYILYWSSSSQLEPIKVHDKTEFDKLRSMECTPYSPDFRCTYNTGSIPVISSESLINELHNSIKNITIKMLCGVEIDPEAIKNFNTTEAYIGLEAMLKMKNDLKDMLSYMQNNPEDTKKGKEFYLSILIMKIGLFKGSRYSFRKEFSSALFRLADETSDKTLFDIANEFANIAKIWTKFFVAINKIKLSGFNAELLKHIFDVFSLIYEKEKQEFYNLATYYEISEE